MKLLFWMTSWAFIAYAPAALVARWVDFMIIRRVCPRKPSAKDFFLNQAGAILLVALFNPILCLVVVGQIYVVIGFSSIAGFDSSWDQLLALWLMSLALPLQLHYTVSAVRVRNLETSDIEPRWLTLNWAASTFLSVTVAWGVLLYFKPEINHFPFGIGLL